MTGLLLLLTSDLRPVVVQCAATRHQSKTRPGSLESHGVPDLSTRPLLVRYLPEKEPSDRLVQFLVGDPIRLLLPSQASVL